MAYENLFTQTLSTGEKVSLQNSGSGVGLILRKDTSGFAFKSLIPGPGISLKTVGDTIVVTNTSAIPHSFLDLTDVPASYAGAAGKFIRYNGATAKLEFSDVPSNYGTILTLVDTPNSYTGANGRVLTVDSTNNQIIFTDLIGTTIAPMQAAIATLTSSLAVVAQKKVAIIDDDPPTDPVEGDLWFKATDGSFYIWYDDNAGWVEIGSAEPVEQPVQLYDYGGSFEGTPTSNQVIFRYRPPFDHILLDEFGSCAFTASHNPNVTFTCRVYVNGVQVGDWHISSTGTAELVTLNTQVIVPAFSEVKIVAPATVVTGISGICMVFVGERQ